MTRSRFPSELIRYVRAAKLRKVLTRTIVRRVRKRWPEYFDFNGWSVGKIVGGMKAENAREMKKREAVAVPIAGPAWSQPKRRVA